jgi:hypothetical protein
MRSGYKKIAVKILAMVLAVTFVIGATEVFDMLGAPDVAVQVLASGGDSSSSSSSSDDTHEQYDNPIKVKGKTVEIKANKVAAKKQTIKRKKAINVSNAKGTVTYKKKSGNKKITINKKTGDITVKKGLKKGKYKVKIAVTAAGTNWYYPRTVTTTVTVKVVTVVNPMTVEGKTAAISAAELATAAKVIPRSNAIIVKKPQGTVTYTKTSGDPGISIDKTTGDITVAQGLAAGTYVLEVNVKAAGNAKYKSVVQPADVTIIIS